jgi:eukaryotic-like serine/threonine-protein kinase
MEKLWIWPFELEEQLGSGAMGQVYRARFVKNDRRVALKLLPKEIAANPTLVARFQREMEVLKDLRHANIVHCFGGVCEGEQQFYAMELVDGGTVASLLAEQGRLTWHQTIEIGLQVCAALACAHDKGVIHRDLKPANLLLTKSGKVKLGDFGLAMVASEVKLTAAGKTMGTLHYMAPEQIHGKTKLSHKTDLYALGCVLFELLTGRPPFVGENMAEILQQHLRQPPPPVSALAPGCPEPLVQLVGELLSKDPDRRPESAQKIARRLSEIGESITVRPPRIEPHRPTIVTKGDTISSLSQPTLDLRRHGMTAIVFLAGLLAGWFATRAWAPRTDQAAAVRVLTEALQSENPTIRAFAADSLGDIGSSAGDAVPVLLGKLDDEDPQVRSRVARALGKIGSGGAVATLTKVVKTDDIPDVRDAAAQAIQELQGASRGNVGLLILGLVLGTAAVIGGFVLWRRLSAAMT